MFRVFDESSKPAEPRLFLLGTYNPPNGRFLIPGCPGLKERPCLFIRFQFLRVFITPLIKTYTAANRNNNKSINQSATSMGRNQQGLFKPLNLQEQLRKS
jgi:hypothetical protein